jgi:hypothetical protein
MSLQPFESHFKDYLSHIREAKEKGASHDYLRQVFIEFSRKSFKVDPVLSISEMGHFLNRTLLHNQVALTSSLRPLL